MSALHADALAQLEGWSAPTREQETLRRSYVDHLRAHPDGLLKSCYPDHLTASALVLSADRSHVLLTLHRKAKRWLQFGGHIEPDDVSLAGAALREATEESGVPHLVLHPDLLHLDLHEVPFCDPRGGVRHLDVRYLAIAEDEAEHAVSAESLDVRWWPVHDLPTEEPSVVDLVRIVLGS